MTTPRQIEESLRDWIPAKQLEFRPGWNTRGWAWAEGLRGLIVHDLVGVDQGAIDWTNAAGESVPYCNSVTANPGNGRPARVIINTVLACYHSGRGGGWPAARIPADVGSRYLWGIEHAVWGRSLSEYSEEMLDLSARTICAVRQASEAWPKLRPWSRVIRHASWTDGGPELGLSYWLPTRGRKVDTLRPLSAWRKDARARWNAGPE